MFNKFSVRGRLIILLIATSLSSVGIGFLGFIGLRGMNSQAAKVYEGGVEQIEPLSELMMQITWDFQMGTARENASSSATYEYMQENQEKIQKGWNKYIAENAYVSEEFKSEWERKTEQINVQMQKIDSFFRKIKEALQQDKKEEFQRIWANDFYSTFQPLITSLKELFILHVKESKADYLTANQNYEYYILIMLVGFSFSFAISLLLAYAIIQSIINPLKYVVENIDKVAKGDTSIDVQLELGGELGQLLDSIRNMILSSKKMSVILAEVASGDLSQKISARSENDIVGISLNKMSNQMRAMIGDIKEEVNTLTAASQEILSSLSQLASGTTESAAAVSETTTTLEELKQTAHVSSEKAKDVLGNADKTRLTVQSSEKSVRSVIQSMDQIKDRMQIISESIVKLSEKSLAIAEIMDTVNDIAEQSNLLAVNAAIEAAKAGEQGRSFSVVAEEIRALAEQSKAATIQVRSLLNDIQNATNAAVLATEQGTKAVAKGVEQSNQTTDAINELAGNMMVVTQSANQIVLSNQQQFIGTEQISLAMSNINESTKQHVDRLKEIESAVAGLNKVSTSLKELTDEYKLTSDGEKESLNASNIPHLIDKLQKKESRKELYEKSVS